MGEDNVLSHGMAHLDGEVVESLDQSDETEEVGEAAWHNKARVDQPEPLASLRRVGRSAFDLVCTAL